MFRAWLANYLRRRNDPGQLAWRRHRRLPRPEGASVADRCGLRTLMSSDRQAGAGRGQTLGRWASSSPSRSGEALNELKAVLVSDVAGRRR
jgi:hypothetical protein